MVSLKYLFVNSLFFILSTQLTAKSYSYWDIKILFPANPNKEKYELPSSIILLMFSPAFNSSDELLGLLFDFKLSNDFFISDIL